MGADALPEAAQGRLAALLREEPLRHVLAALNGGGEETRLVGGAVRNTLMGEPLADIDMATTCLPQETMRRAAAAGFKPVPTGIEHGTVTLVAAGRAFEVTTLRQDIDTDGRRATVRFGRDFAGDAARRDFTINALMLSLDGRLHDVVGGVADAAARRVRFIGEPERRIAEDYLRILRFFRFHAAYGAGAPDAAGLRACIAARAGIDGLSRERIRAEVMKLLVAPGAGETLALMADCGLWQQISGGVAHRGRLTRLAASWPEAGAEMRLGALAVMVREDAERLRDRFRLSNAEGEMLARMGQAGEALHGEALHGLAAPGGPAVRALAYRLGRKPVLAMLAALFAEAAFTAGAAAIPDPVPALPWTGRDVLALGLKPGPDVGRVLAAAEARWIGADFPAGEEELARILRHAVAASA